MRPGAGGDSTAETGRGERDAPGRAHRADQVAARTRRAEAAGRVRSRPAPGLDLARAPAQGSGP